MKIVITPCRYREIVKNWYDRNEHYKAEEVEAVLDLLPRRILRGAYMSEEELKIFRSEYDEIERNIRFYWGGGEGTEIEEIFKIEDRYFRIVYFDNEYGTWNYSIKEVVPKQVMKTIYEDKEFCI